MEVVGGSGRRRGDFELLEIDCPVERERWVVVATKQKEKNKQTNSSAAANPRKLYGTE